MSPAPDVRRHIITGGNGFVGRYLASALSAQNKETLILDVEEPETLPPNARYVRGDIRSANDIAALQLSPADVVYHLAARQFHGDVPRRDRDAWFGETNVGGTEKLLDAAARTGIAGLIFFSTDMTYGKPQRTPIKPTDPQNPIGPYGRSKLEAERLIRAAQQKGAVRATIFRPRLIAGAGRLGILKKLFTLIRHNLPVPLIGSGYNRYQMVAVEDCVSAAFAAVERGFPSGPFNLGSNDPPTVRQLLRALVSHVNSRSPLVPIPARLLQIPLKFLDAVGLPLLYPEQYEIANLDYILDLSETEALLGWQPSRRDEDIIRDAYMTFVTNVSKERH